MLNRLAAFGQSKWYWLGLLLFGIALEAVALFYQYYLDEWPCVLCIHVRIWVMGLIIVAMLALLINSRLLRNLAHMLMVIIMVGLLKTSWMLLGVERGFTIGSCNMDSGLPDWFALDKWFPIMFEVQTTCGYTPELLFGITMAEGLLVISVVLMIISAVLVISGFTVRK